MSSATTTAFDLPAHLHPKADPALIADDERHFAAIAESLEQTIASLSERLDAARLAPGGEGQAAMDRDFEIHRTSARLRTLRRFSLDLCLGRMVSAADGETVYVGRLGLTDSEGRRLLVDWRSPAAEPFFGATHANPMDLKSRRRYRWTGGRITDYWDEVFDADGVEGYAALDDQSAFIASLGSSRSPQMRDVLGTIQADQDAIIRASSRGTLVVDGGPGTGKTVVALHRTAYLLYSDPRLGHQKGGVLFVGPHQPYLAYVADVLPSLGEEGVQTCTLRDLLPQGAGAPEEADAEVARLKASAAMVKAIEPAVRLYEEPPTEGMEVETPYADIWLSPSDWVEAFGTADPGTPHNEARDQIWEELVTIVVDKVDDDDVPADLLRRSLVQNTELVAAFNKAWTLIDPADLVGDLWSVPAYLRMCAPWLEPDQVRRLQRADPQAWTVSDLPLLDAARHRLGDPQASRRKRRRDAVIAAEREQMADVVDHLIATDDSEMQVMSMLRVEDAQTIIVDESAVADADPDLLAGPFAHIVVDEAQELTDAEWQMLLLRCPSRSFTIVGDRAQARHGFTESWEERLARIGLDHVNLASLSINYRTPEEVMAAAEPVIRTVLPDANVPISVRSTGLPVRHGSVAELDSILAGWLEEHAEGEGIACVIGDPSFPATSRIRSLAPETVKGLEFDLVVLIDPESFGDRHRRGGRPLRRDDQGDPAARDPGLRLRQLRAAGGRRTHDGAREPDRPTADDAARTRGAPARPGLPPRPAGVAVAHLPGGPRPGGRSSTRVRVRRVGAPLGAPAGAVRARHAAPAQQGGQPADRGRHPGRPRPPPRPAAVVLEVRRPADHPARVPRGTGARRRAADRGCRRRPVPADQPDPLDDPAHAADRRRAVAAQLRRVPGQRAHGPVRQRRDLLLPLAGPADREPHDGVVPARPTGRPHRPGGRVDVGRRADPSLPGV